MLRFNQIKQSVLACSLPNLQKNISCVVQLEERVREWQESPASALNSWVHQQENWVDCVVSALKFLSGDVLGNFSDPERQYFERILKYLCKQ